MKHASMDKAKRVSNGCRNNGSCPYCRRSRLIRALRLHALFQSKIKHLHD